MGVAIIAEASGEAEAHDQLPLRPYAPSGAILERTLRRMGYARDQFVLSNIVRCRPWNNFLEGAPYEQAAISHCQPNVLSLLNRYKPKVIVALGNVPFRTLTGISGKQRTISHMRGYVFRALPEYCAAAGNPDLLVVPTYHPAFLRRGAIHLTGVLARDIQRAVNIRAGRDKNFILDMPAMNYTDITNDPFADDSEIHAAARGQSDLTAWMARHGLRYQLNPTLADLDAFCREVKAISDRWVALSPDAKRHDLTALSYDLETGESASLDEDASDGFTDTIIKQVQFSISAQTGVAFPWQQPYIRASHWLLKLPLPKIGQNIYYFDNRVLEAVGERDFGKRDYFTPAGPVHDILQMFHFWQPDLPAHLQFAASFAEFPFPWKHLADTNLPFYGCVDVDAPHRVYRVMRQTMEDRGIWDDPDRARAAYGYVNQLEAVRPILAEMEDTGIPINNERRMALGVEFDAAETDLLAELDKMFPSAARKVHPKEGYKKIPPQVKALLANGTPESDIPSVAFQDSPSARPDGTEKEGDFYHYEIREFVHPALLESGDVSTSWVPRWCRVYNFSPNSPNQVRAYMRVRGHKVPISKDGDETTGKHELMKLANKHKDKFYAKIIECREVRKMRSTYIDGYKPRADGRVHPTFTFFTATGQLSARNPNCFSADTEILTDRGWVLFPDLRKTDHVAEWTWHPEYSDIPRVRFGLPTAYIKEFYCGDLLHIETDKQVDLLVTADHGCLLHNRQTRKTHRIPAMDYPEDWRQIQAGLYDGGQRSLRGSQVVLLCALQADGSVDKSNGYDFGLTKERKAVRLREALLAEGISYTYSTRKSGQRRFRISFCNIPTWWRNKKYFGAWLLELDRSTLDALAEEIWFWDGCYRRRSAYSSSVKANTDWAQIITLLSNRRARVRLYQGEGTRNDNWQVDASSNNYSMTTNRTITKLPYNDFVYCVTMPWSSVIVRRNGRVAFTGQSQNYPSRSRLADAVKSMIEAPEGYEIANWDFKSYHVLTLGLLAGDAAYMRMGSIDMHSFVTSHFLKVPGADKLHLLSDDELRAEFSRQRKDERFEYVRNNQSKPSLLGIALGLMPPHLYEMNREHFDSLAHAKKFREVIQGLFPRVFQWQAEICEQAHREGRLTNRFGMVRWFYEVKRPDGHGGMVPGDQYNEAMAFPVQSEAHGELREKIKKLAAAGHARKYGLCNTIHDSLTFCYRRDLRESHIRDVYAVLRQPSEVLRHPVLAPGGLIVGVECSVGRSMAKKDRETVSLDG